ncbi:hypothetical protein BESB_045200 [Besnoitia besnoiti]|uniref:Transmembrane protein n=1 Tax=Besnoitia besnoiti TaxID=94643 RepID=A0A2A9MCV8_BESBE|nr:hypothetical protein BESB_045200 [Besnoitia besnoiti]PFH36328.1 hypothetical protein BESB_045200 [Besnoitia besnoiti]
MPSLSSVGVATLVILAAAGPFLQFGYAGGVLDCTEPTECGSTPPPVRLASSAPSVWRAAVCAFLASPVKRGSFSVGPLDGSPSLTIDAQLPLHHDDPVYAAAPFVCLLLALLVADFLTVSAKYLWVVSKRSCPQRSALNIASFKRFVGYIVAAPGNASMEGSSGGEGTGVRDDGVPEPLHRASGVRRRAPGQSEGGSQLAGAESGRAEDEAEGNCQILVRELRALRAENAAGGRGGASDFVAQAKLQRRIIRLEQQLEKTARDRTARGDLGDHEHTGDVYDMMDSVFGSGRRQRSFLIGLEGAVGQAVNRTVAAVASSLFKVRNVPLLPKVTGFQDLNQ